MRKAGTVENIPLQTLERRGTVPPTEHTVPGDRRNRDGLLLPLRPRGEPGRKHVAPTLVEIGLHDPLVIARAAAAVRNRVAVGHQTGDSVRRALVLGHVIAHAEMADAFHNDVARPREMRPRRRDDERLPGAERASVAD